jgi:hypothetical protein
MSLYGRKKRVALVLSCGVLLALGTACSKQAEGERCDREKAGDSDCEDGLRCIQVGSADRCCPPEDSPISDDRCDPTQVPVGGSGGMSGGTTGGTDGGNVSGGTAGTDGGTSAGNGSSGTAGTETVDPTAGASGAESPSGAGGA